MTGAPRASRPQMPGYGLPPAAEGTWEWAWAEEILTAATRYWLATTRPGRPHLMPVWGLWQGGTLWFSTGARSVKAANLAADPHCAASVERGPHAVVLEGTAHLVAAPPEDVLTGYAAKYRTGVPPGEPVYRLDPTVAFGLSDAEGEFAQATRWRFG